MPDQPYNEAYIKAKIAQVKRGKLQAQKNPHVSRADRLPPGQVLTDRFPVLDLGLQPAFEEKFWDFQAYGEVEDPLKFTWPEWQQLPTVDLTADFHCVTRWSRFDVHWTGVPFQAIADMAKVKPTAKFVSLECADGYTTNLSLDECLNPRVILAWKLEGEVLPKEHGGPLRLIHPFLYGWKSAKFLRKIRFTAEDEPGFWEVRGYHNHADPWKEERYG